MSFCDEELPEEGRNHNIALHISMNCKEDVLSNVLVDIGYSLNVIPKSTLSRLSYQGALMRYSGVIVKAFDGSRKIVIGEVDLPMKIGPSDFQITFQVMDIHPAYSCLLGRPWIHEAGAVTSTLHQKLKFVKNGKLVIIGGEKALLVSHLSSFSYMEAEDEVETPFQALSITEEKRVGPPMSSFKDAQKIVEDGNSDQWGQMVEVTENKSKAAEEGSDEEVSDELSHLLEHEEKAIQPFEEQIELVNLGSEDDVKEVKIGEDKRRSAKQIDDGFLVTAEYSQRVANIMHVPKKDGKVCMCVDYRVLNKASSKDDFPLPHINMLVYNISKFKVFSFMLRFFGYNQIKMAPEDMQKTTFITPWGTFYYRVMPFGLKKAGATYQRAMTTLKFWYQI
ncbi:hypothetical protein KIW84_054401 [Lathyrus oleraceus]|uniref:Reverse transcriptase domain-containing protein n=1 Tax=Pisum sativum TaxID=3888 RepID=A0A9D4WV78_PEA|nr:hypothetical protein KIW84_054401 [Pisum sativum]